MNLPVCLGKASDGGAIIEKAVPLGQEREKVRYEFVPDGAQTEGEAPLTPSEGGKPWQHVKANWGETRWIVEYQTIAATYEVPEPSTAFPRADLIHEEGVSKPVLARGILAGDAPDEGSAQVIH
jgi:hypothetical protein